MIVGIIDYGMGNLYSVRTTLEYFGFCDTIVVTSPNELKKCDKIILPGVGAFKKAMDILRATRLDEAIVYFASQLERPIMGICLGMQLLTDSSTEGEYTKGLGLISGCVERFNMSSLKIPHVGFNEVSFESESVLFANFNLENPDFYFTHSYRVQEVRSGLVSTCLYGESFVATFEKNNIYGTQFHPELSQTNGLKLFENFLRL